MFKCSNGNCIREKWRCDGDNDCNDGSDENELACSKYFYLTDSCYIFNKSFIINFFTALFLSDI